MLSLQDKEILAKEGDVNYLRKNYDLSASALALTDKILHAVLSW